MAAILDATHDIVEALREMAAHYLVAVYFTDTGATTTQTSTTGQESSKGKNMKSSELMELAKTFLWDGKSDRGPYQQSAICYALFWAAQVSGKIDPHRHNTHYQIADDVIERVSPYVMLSSKFAAERDPKLPPLTIADTQRMRHEFLDNLIAEYKKNGD